MARPRMFDESEVIAAAAGAFRARGYAGTSVADLVKATGLGKGSLYGAFGDKHSLYMRALEDYCARRVADGTASLEGGGRGVDRLRSYLLMMSSGSTDGAPGCLMTAAGAELAGHDAQVRDRLARTYAALRGALATAVRDAQDEGDIDPEADAEVVAGLLLTVARGIDALAGAGADVTELRRTADTTIAGLRPSAPPP